MGVFCRHEAGALSGVDGYVLKSPNIICHSPTVKAGKQEKV